MPPRQEGQDTRSWRWRVLLPLCAFSWAINNLLLEKEKGNCSCECWSIPAHAKKSCIKISENYKYKKWLDFHKRLGSTFCTSKQSRFQPYQGHATGYGHITRKRVLSDSGPTLQTWITQKGSKIYLWAFSRYAKIWDICGHLQLVSCMFIKSS